ncbi:MAG: hypothetical protein HYR97_08505 [Candidatus Melainabacteria bacterium]|nr:hypothetical protein [Candidatus Melainabacteria bacterium]MBI3308958.1 hypothetical protein [Candidatus Melainabacteria bacterium]
MRLNIIIILFLIFFSSFPASASLNEIEERKQRALSWYESYINNIKPYKTYARAESEQYKASALRWFDDTFVSKKHFHPYLEYEKQLHQGFALSWFEKNNK